MEESAKYNLRPLWDAILEVYIVFANICERHSLRYCADCGTALGAVRHGGFIPWDDDMDIQMPRPDYERFVEIAPKELPPGYAWLDRFNSAEYDNPFGKVIVEDDAKVKAVAEAAGRLLDQGIFIDVFPLDGYPDSKIARMWRKVQNVLLCFNVDSHIGWCSCPTWKSKVGFVLGTVLRPFNYRIWKRRDVSDFYEKRAKKYPFGATEMCVSIGVARYDDDKPYPSRYFGTPKEVAFDCVDMPVQENVDGYLTCVFGDYMKLPPQEKRIPSHSRLVFAEKQNCIFES